MGVALLNRHRGSTRVGRSGVARTIGCRHICATAALLTLLYGAPAMRCAWQTMLGNNYVLHGMAVCRHHASRRDRKLDGRHAAEPSSEEMVDSEISVTRAKSVQPR